MGSFCSVDVLITLKWSAISVSLAFEESIDSILDLDDFLLSAWNGDDDPLDPKGEAPGDKFTIAERRSLLIEKRNVLSFLFGEKLKVDVL